ncbi:MAG: SMP-30/gluconolactonase/LRE family protein [Salinisphaeraceae bacterium]
MITIGDFTELNAAPYARLPDALRWRGAPSPWARMTRPGVGLHSFLEAATFLDDDRLMLCDVACGRILQIDRTGAWTTLLTYGGAPHAARPWGRSDLVILDYDHGLMLWSPGNGQPRPWIAGAAGAPFHGLSDAVLGPDGALWFTDSGRSSLAAPIGGLYRLDANAAGEAGLRLVLDGIPYPNGVAVAADGRSVLVAVTRANAVWRISLPLPDDGPAMAGVFLPLSGGLGPDGLAVEPGSGRIALAQAQAGRAYVFDVMGDPLFVIRTPGRWTTSVAFGPDDALYVVEAEEGAVWRADLPPSAPRPPPTISADPEERP